MAKREILFNDEVYSIEESVIEASLAEMKSRLVDDYSGSGTTIIYDGTTINVDSAKLATAASHLAATLNRFAGSGASIVVNGVTYGIDSAKLGSVKENMSGTLGEMAGVVEEEDELAGTWVFNITISSRLNNQINVNFASNGVDYEAISDERDADPVDYLWYGRWTTPQSVPTVYYYDMDTWTDIDYRTITITSKLSEVYDGEALLAWLKAEATKQSAVEPEAPEEPVEDTLAGTWFLNSSITIPSDDFSVNMYFGLPNTEWYKSDNWGFGNINQYWNKLDATKLYFCDVGGDDYTMYENGNWTDENYRTIVFTGNYGDPASNGWNSSRYVSEEVALAWFKANAVKQSATSLITFTIDGTSYQAEDGMTWGEWVESEYNPTTIPRCEVIGLTGVGYAWDEYNTWIVRIPNSSYDVSTTDIIEPIEYESCNPSSGGGVN